MKKSGSEKSVALTKDIYSGWHPYDQQKNWKKGQTYILYVENPNSQETQKLVYTMILVMA